MDELFVTCTDSLMACLSEHDLTALLTLYTSRQAQAKTEVDLYHIKNVHDGLPTAWLTYRAICTAIVQEQKRRIR